jgi:hypothetical protein
VLQDRWVKALRLAGCKTVEEANALLPQLVQRYHERFAMSCQFRGQLLQVQTEDQAGYHLRGARVLCARTRRKTASRCCTKARRGLQALPAARAGKPHR